MKRMIISGIIGLSAGICGMLFAGNTAPVDAWANVQDFCMEYGASIRINETDGKDGIRFTATLVNGEYEALEKQQTETLQVSYGMLIIPADYTVEGKSYVAPLSKETLFGKDASYTIIDCTPNTGDNTCTCGKKHLSGVEYETLPVSNGRAVLRGSLVDLKEGNRMREFIGLGYIKRTTGEECEYIIAENAKNKDGTGEASVLNNTRSMSYVAQLAIADNPSRDNTSLYETYVQPFETKNILYTVQHYIPNENGTYGEPIIQTAYAPLGSEVNAVHIAQGALAEEYAQYASYTLDLENGQTKNVVYANGKTVLTCYYKQESIEFTRTVDFSNQEDLAYLITTDAQTCAWKESEQEKNGVAVYCEDIVKRKSIVLNCYLNFNEDIEKIEKAFFDDNYEFSIQLNVFMYNSLEEKTMKVDTGDGDSKSVSTGKWIEVNITKEQLKVRITDTETLEKYLAGEYSLFQIIGGNAGNSERTITCCFDSITYAVKQK